MSETPSFPSKEVFIPGPFIFLLKILISNQVSLMISQPSACKVFFFELFFRSGGSKDTFPLMLLEGANQICLYSRSVEKSWSLLFSLWNDFPSSQAVDTDIYLHFAFSFGPFKENFTGKARSNCSHYRIFSVLFSSSFSNPSPAHKSQVQLE